MCITVEVTWETLLVCALCTGFPTWDVSVADALFLLCMNESCVCMCVFVCVCVWKRWTFGKISVCMSAHQHVLCQRWVITPGMSWISGVVRAQWPPPTVKYGGEYCDIMFGWRCTCFICPVLIGLIIQRRVNKSLSHTHTLSLTHTHTESWSPTFVYPLWYFKNAVLNRDVPKAAACVHCSHEEHRDVQCFPLLLKFHRLFFSVCVCVFGCVCVCVWVCVLGVWVWLESFLVLFLMGVSWRYSMYQENNALFLQP